MFRAAQLAINSNLQTQHGLGHHGLIFFSDKECRAAGHQGQLLEVFHRKGSRQHQDYAVLLTGRRHFAHQSEKLPSFGQLHDDRLVHGMAENGVGKCVPPIFDGHTAGAGEFEISIF